MGTALEKMLPVPVEAEFTELALPSSRSRMVFSRLSIFRSSFATYLKPVSGLMTTSYEHSRLQLVSSPVETEILLLCFATHPMTLHWLQGSWPSHFDFLRRQWAHCDMEQSCQSGAVFTSKQHIRPLTALAVRFRGGTASNFPLADMPTIHYTKSDKKFTEKSIAVPEADRHCYCALSTR